MGFLVVDALKQLVRFQMRRTDRKFGVGQFCVGVAQRLVRWIANSVMRFRLPSPTLIDTYSNFLQMIGDPCVIGSSPILHPNGAVSSTGRATLLNVSSFIPKDSLSRENNAKLAGMGFESSEGCAQSTGNWYRLQKLQPVAQG